MWWEYGSVRWRIGRFDGWKDRSGGSNGGSGWRIGGSCGREGWRNEKRGGSVGRRSGGGGIRNCRWAP